MKKKIIALVMALCICIGILASCGNDVNDAKAEIMNDFNLFGISGDKQTNLAYTTATKLNLGDGIVLKNNYFVQDDAFYKFPIKIVKNSENKYGVYSFKSENIVVPVEYDDITITNGLVIAKKTTVESNEKTVNTYTIFDRNFTSVKTSVDKAINLSVQFIGNNEYAFVTIENATSVYTIGTDGSLTLKEEMNIIPKTNDTIGATGLNKMNLLYVFGQELDGYYMVSLSAQSESYQIFNGDKSIGTIEFPSNIKLGLVTFNNTVIYQTENIVDANAKYTYSDGENRYLVRTFAVDIKNAKTKEIKTDAVFTSLKNNAVYSKDGSEIIARVINARKIENYILQDEKTYLLGSDATLSDPITAVDFDRDMIKLNDNRYLVYKPGFNGAANQMQIVDKELNVISNLSGLNILVNQVYGGYLTAQLSDGTKLLIDADGKVIIGQDKGYNYIGIVVNGKAFTINSNNDCGIVDISTGNLTSISYDKANQSVGMINKYGNFTPINEITSDKIGIFSFSYVIKNADGKMDFFSIANGQKAFDFEADDQLFYAQSYTNDFMIVTTRDGIVYKFTASTAA